jgi:hypothetical protein
MLVGFVAAGCRPRQPEGETAGAPAGDWFVDRAVETGLAFVHFNGMSGRFYYPEMFGPGVGLVDIDNDGDLDVYVVQGQMLGNSGASGAATVPPPGELRDRLFRNDLVVHEDGTRTLRFTEVTARSGIDIRSYGMGVAAGDFDNDGWTDLYRTGVGGGVLLKNRGDGTFQDVTAAARVANAGSWGVSAAFVDYDRDGWLDLFVGNYVDYRVGGEDGCVTLSGRQDYCPPHKYPAQRDRLYRNRGNGTFDDVTDRALVGGAYGPALGVSTADFDGDGWIDIYVGNDGTPNQLWINQRDGTLRDVAFRSGVAVSGSGAPEASMGIDAGDIDNDGDEELFVTNWASQMHVLYVNLGSGLFEDRRAAAGLGAPTLSKTGFGTAFFDYDNDGWLDLLTVNGGVAIVEAQARAGDRFPYRMTNQLFRNIGSGRFEDVTARAGAIFSVPHVGRGAAFGDIDNDGDTDVVVGNDAGPVQLLVNTVGQRNRWIGLRLVSNPPQSGSTVRGTTARTPGRDMLGARVGIVLRDGRTIWRRVRADGSYASANDPRVLVGLGPTGEPAAVRVRWPDGRIEEWKDVSVGRYTALEQGAGVRIPES